MTRTANRFWLLLPVLWLAAGATSAQEARKHSTADTATVVAVDPATGTLTVSSEGRTESYRVDAKTEIQLGAEEIPLVALQPGTRVAISANREGATPTDLPVADRVQVVQAEPGQTAQSGAPGAVAAAGAGGGAAGAAAGAAGAGKLGAVEARAEMRGADGQSAGEVQLRTGSSGLLIHASLENLPAGVHAFHIHETGRCEGDFSSAGDHFAPRGNKHGFFAQGGPHAGDLVNLGVGADGKVVQDLHAPGLGIDDLLDADGAAVVVHAGADDYVSQPSGAAGDRIACGVIERTAR